MRLTLTLKPLTPDPYLMWNYHYPLASWLYSVITKADSEYAGFLHEEGFHVKQKKAFKHFTFSDLQARISYQKGDSGFQILSPTIQWTVSFYIDEIAEKFIAGLFHEQTLQLFNQDYKASFKIENLETRTTFHLNTTTFFRATSLMVVAEKKEGKDKYLEPTDPRFEEYLISGLIDKYLSIIKERNEVIDANLIEQEISFKLVDQSKMKSRKITIKERKKAATEIKGYRDFTFALTGPKEVIEVGFLGGFGRYCSEGCGFCEIVP
ncbi:CRISPR-associated endoribonuclease Cas6 [Emticicia fontis]